MFTVRDGRIIALPRALPAQQGIHISEHFRVRKDRVDRDGKLTLRHNSRLHHIGIGHDRPAPTS